MAGAGRRSRRGAEAVWGDLGVDTFKNYLIGLLALLLLGAGVYIYMQRGGGDTAGIDQAVRDIQAVRAEQRAIVDQLKTMGTELATIRGEIGESRAELERIRGEIAAGQQRLSADYGLIVEGRGIVEAIQQRDQKP